MPGRFRRQGKMPPLRVARASGLGDRLVALFLLGLALFNPPLLSVFDVGASFLGLPVLPLYLFGAWGGLVLALALVLRPSHENERSEEENEEGDRP